MTGVQTCALPISRTALDWDQDAGFRAVRADLAVTVPERARVVATIASRGFSAASDLATPDRLVAAVSADVVAWQSISVFATYARDLAVVAAGASSSRYRPSDTFLAGIRLAAPFRGGGSP